MPVNRFFFVVDHMQIIKRLCVRVCLLLHPNVQWLSDFMNLSVTSHFLLLLWIPGCWATWILDVGNLLVTLTVISVIYVCLLIISLFSNYIPILLHLFSTGYSLGSINQGRTFLVQWLAQVLNKPIRISLSGRWILNAMIQRRKMVGDHSAWCTPGEEGPC